MTVDKPTALPTDSPGPVPTLPAVPEKTPAPPAYQHTPTPPATPESVPTPPPATAHPKVVVSSDDPFNITEDTLGRDVAVSLTEAEASCVREEMGDEGFEDLQESRVLAGHTWLDSVPIDCLAEETASSLSIALVAGAIGGLSANSRECLGAVYTGSGAIGLGFVLGNELSLDENGEAVRFALHFITCLTDAEAEALAQESDNMDAGIAPSDFRCLFESVEVDAFTEFLFGFMEAELVGPSPEFLKTIEAVSSATDRCEIDALRRLTPPPVADERLLWRFRTASYVLGSPVVGDGLVFVHADDVYALDAASGELLWRTHVDGQAWLTFFDGALFLSSSGRLKALDAATGDTLWSFETGPIYHSTPAVANGTVYVGSWDDRLYAVDAATGQLTWSHETGGGIRSSPTVSRGVVYFRSNDGLLYALDAGTGAIRWTYRTGDPLGHYQSAVVSGGVVYTGTGEYVIAVDAASGDLLWQTEQRIESDTRLVVADGIVYSTSGYTLDAVNAETGVLLWQYPIGLRVSSPTVAGGVVYIGSEDGHLYAIDAKTGSALWRFRTGGQIYSTPAVEDSVVYFGSADDHLYAVSTADDVPVRVITTPGTAPLEGVAVLTPDPPSHYQDARQFGVALAMSGDGATIAVGDSKKYSERKYDGAVYVFTREGRLWGDLAGDAAAKLLPPEDNDWEPVPGDRLGGVDKLIRTVRSGERGGTIVVGAPDNLPHGYDSGAAYVFTRPSSEGEAATLTASDGAPLDRFGHAVAISADGRTIVVGSTKSYGAGPSRSHVFTRPAGGWTDSTENARLTVPGGGLGDSVAVSQDGAAIFVGASQASQNGVSSGAVYVFTRPGPKWVDATASARLTPSDGADDDRFGTALAASNNGSVVVVGAPKKDAYGSDHGAAYVYVRPEPGWRDTVETAALTASDGARGDHFGLSLATTADGSRIVVGSPFHAHTLQRSGGAYEFTRPADGWADAIETMELPKPADPPRGLFGGAVAFGGETFAVGVPGIAVYVFNQTPSGDPP